MFDKSVRLCSVLMINSNHSECFKVRFFVSDFAAFIRRERERESEREREREDLYISYHVYKLLTKIFFSPNPSSETDDDVLRLLWKLEVHYPIKVLHIPCIFNSVSGG